MKQINQTDIEFRHKYIRLQRFNAALVDLVCCAVTLLLTAAWLVLPILLYLLIVNVF